MQPDVKSIPLQHAADHHVLEASRVRNFCTHIEAGAKFGRETKEGGLSLDKAGHLMYASHVSYTNDAMLRRPKNAILLV